MDKPTIVSIEQIDNNRTRYSLSVPTTRTGAHIVVVIVNAEDEVVTVSDDAGKQAADRAVAAVYDYIHRR